MSPAQKNTTRLRSDPFGIDGRSQWWIECPVCRERATLRFPAEGAPGAEWKLTCAACGHVRSEKAGSRSGLEVGYWLPSRSATLVIEHVLVTRERGPDGKSVRTRRVIGRLEAQLWLQRAFRGETVWACNPEHLAELESLIGAKLRERSRNPGAGHRLPAWLLASKNRADLVKVLAWLRRRVQEGAQPKRGAPKSSSTARSVRRARGPAPLVELA